VRRCGWLLGFVLAACSGPAPVDEKSPPRVEPDRVSSVVPIEHVEPGGSHDDLKPLGPSFAGARVIAIGEATHGSHEFFTLRHRLLAWAIEELGVRALAIESSMAEVVELDRYIQGEGEPDRARSLVARNSSWPWRTVEFAHTLEWLRAHNREREVSERVHIYGFDIQQPWVTLEALRSALTEHSSVELLLEFEVLELLAVTPARYQEYDDARRDRISVALAELDTHLRGVTPPIDPLLLRIYGTLAQVEQHYRASGHRGVSPPREQAMADNIAWLADTQHPRAPMLVWAHNGHISRAPLHSSHEDAMGRHLAQRFGAGFVNVGFLFERGDFLAKDRLDEAQPIRTFSLPDGPSDGLAARLAAEGPDVFAWDLRTIPQGSLRAWLSEPHKAWAVGSTVSDPEKQVGEFELLACFDVIVFVETVMAAQLMSKAEDH
jgi:erythromycin esterase